MDNAQTNIRFLAFSFTHDELGDAMLARAIAGVDESGVFEKVGSQTQHAELTKLFCANIPVRQDGKPSFLNRKYIVVDDQIVITSSLNFSNNANTSNAENVVIVDTSDIAALYIQEFDRVWTQGKVPDPAKLKCN
ncbi:MAG: phospholipase D-like domain-containing protein [Anaerolineae bacterium]|nr:phospholipase D-like domain-containing protein [Anaerolineae bacterium]